MGKLEELAKRKPRKYTYFKLASVKDWKAAKASGNSSKLKLVEEEEIKSNRKDIEMKQN